MKPCFHHPITFLPIAPISFTAMLLLHICTPRIHVPSLLPLLCFLALLLHFHTHVLTILTQVTAPFFIVALLTVAPVTFFVIPLSHFCACPPLPLHFLQLQFLPYHCTTVPNYTPVNSCYTSATLSATLVMNPCACYTFSCSSPTTL